VSRSSSSFHLVQPRPFVSTACSNDDEIFLRETINCAFSRTDAASRRGV
jgi:hypothetical protein